MTPGQFAAMCRRLATEVQSANQQLLHAEAGFQFRKAQAENFQRESDSRGRKWPPRKHHYPHPILRKTLRMMNAASQFGSLGNISRSQGKRLSLGIRGTDVPYAKFHQFGTLKLPKREFFYLRPEDRDRLRPAAKNHLLRVFNQTRGKRG